MISSIHHHPGQCDQSCGIDKQLNVTSQNNANWHPFEFVVKLSKRYANSTDYSKTVVGVKEILDLWLGFGTHNLIISKFIQSSISNWPTRLKMSKPGSLLTRELMSFVLPACLAFTRKYTEPKLLNLIKAHVHDHVSVEIQYISSSPSGINSCNTSSMQDSKHFNCSLGSFATTTPIRRLNEICGSQTVWTRFRDWP